MINPQDFAREHDFSTAAISWTERGYWIVTVHGKDTGEFGCASSFGDTPKAAAAALLKNVRTYREDVAAIAAGEEAAKAKRIAAIRAELVSLTGQAA